MKKDFIQKLPIWMRKLLEPDVITQMRIRFVATAMAILILVFIIMLGSINMIMKTVSQSQSMRLLEEIAQSNRYDTLNQEPELRFEKPLEDIPPPESEPKLTGNIAPLAWIPEDYHQKTDGNRFPGNRPDQRFPDKDNYPEDPDDDFNDSPPFDSGHWQENPPEPFPPEWSEFAFPEDNEPPATELIPDSQYVPEPEQPISEPIPDDPIIESEFLEDSEMTEIIPEEEITETESLASTESTEMSATTESMTTFAESTEQESSQITATETIPEPPENNFQEHDFRLEPRPDKWKVNIMLDHFAVMADPDGNFLGLRNTENYTSEQASEILSAILNTGKQQGMYNWLQYYKIGKSYGTLVVIADKSSDQGLLNNLFQTTAIIGILMLLILFVFLIFFSRKITTPVQAALDRQKQFVSDAGHELKTPLAVLTANADILKDEIGENKWLDYMQEQTDRMSQLVGDLLRLARMDNATQEYSLAEFNLSRAVEATALPFESQAFELEKNLELDIQPDVSYYGSEQHIRQLVAIFIDNAMKYSDEHGIIKITLLRRGDDRILEFYNTGCEISQEETHKIFERFYRGDKARNNKGKNGYGLGLAIARSIMDMHHIRIQVTCEQGAWIRFFLIL
ncbi:MAG: HAMP domain-containing histidine kinase [Oscillospiraceae bacterium]|nr:HAMP domain-containing histidine kinase [Oscillospiraceae bacterium]